jgi:hypothetical protein
LHKPEQKLTEGKDLKFEMAVGRCLLDLEIDLEQRIFGNLDK